MLLELSLAFIIKLQDGVSSCEIKGGFYGALGRYRIIEKGGGVSVEPF